MRIREIAAVVTVGLGAAEAAGAAGAAGRGWADLEQPLTGTEPAAAIIRTAESSISISFKFSIVYRGRSV